MSLHGLHDGHSDAMHQMVDVGQTGAGPVLVGDGIGRWIVAEDLEHGGLGPVAIHRCPDPAVLTQLIVRVKDPFLS